MGSNQGYILKSFLLQDNLRNLLINMLEMNQNRIKHKNRVNFMKPDKKISFKKIESV